MYYTRIFNTHKNDIKKTWSFINDTLNKKSKRDTVTKFIVDNKKLIDPDEIANAFNEYFINIGRSLADQIQPMNNYNDYLNNKATSRFVFSSINEDTVLNLIDKLKK